MHGHADHEVRDKHAHAEVDNLQDFRLIANPHQRAEAGEVELDHVREPRIPKGHEARQQGTRSDREQRGGDRDRVAPEGDGADAGGFRVLEVRLLQRRHSHARLHVLGESGLVEHGERVGLLCRVQDKEFVLLAIGGVVEGVADVGDIGMADAATGPVKAVDAGRVERASRDNAEDRLQGDDHPAKAPTHRDLFAIDDVGQRDDAVSPVEERPCEDNECAGREPGEECLELGRAGEPDGESKRCHHQRP